MRGGITRIEADFKSMTGAQRKACYMIAQGESYAMVAKKLKVSTRVLARWRSIYEFQSVLRALMIFYADEAFNSINTSLPLVLDSLRDIALNGKRDSDRITAGKTLIQSWGMMKETMDRNMVDELARRVVQLESEHGRNNPHGYNEDQILLELRGASQQSLLEEVGKLASGEGGEEGEGEEVEVG